MIFQKAIVYNNINGDTVEVKLDNGTKERAMFLGINCPKSTLRHKHYGKEIMEGRKEVCSIRKMLYNKFR